MLSVGTTTIQTSLIGGSTPGTAFNDAMAENWPAEMMIDLKHPIVEMRFRCGWIIDGFSVTYRLTNGQTRVKVHGSAPTGSTDTTGMNVLLNDYENVVAVFGRAGRQSYYNRNMINSMGLVIFDSAKASMRIVGPFGNGNSSNNGEPFYVTDPIAFAGYSTDGPDNLGLCGISFIKNDSVSQ
uniref:Lectin n=1 Tax=Grifola frondosa TaxID=5627 RepID=Q3V798_GRIFR|nr:lectin [Grifola frondosa]